MQYRQGDVWIENVDEIPAGAKPVRSKNGRLVLAAGEATGHAHSLSARSGRLREVAGTIYLLLLRRALLEHEEHGKIELPPGKYLVRRQREYHPEEIRRVQD